MMFDKRFYGVVHILAGRVWDSKRMRCFSVYLHAKVVGKYSQYIRHGLKKTNNVNDILRIQFHSTPLSKLIHRSTQFREGVETTKRPVIIISYSAHAHLIMISLQKLTGCRLRSRFFLCRLTAQRWLSGRNVRLPTFFQIATCVGNFNVQ